MIHNWRRRRKEYEEAWSYYKSTWFTWNKILYDVCEKYPYHKNRSHVAAKIGLVGRSNAAGLERHSTKDIAGIVDFVQKNGRLIDNMFVKLKKIKEPLTEEKLGVIIGVHANFLNVLRRITRRRNSVRSFASKYMHFHCPAVPIFDNIALGVIMQKDLYPLTNKQIKRFRAPHNSDDVYYDYCVRFFAMYRDIRASGLRVDVRRLDNYLLWSNGA